MTASDENLPRLEAECRRLAEALALAQRDAQLLGFEIHDGVVQDLTAAAMLLEGAARQASFESPDAKESYEGGVRLLQAAIAAARRVVQGAAIVGFDEEVLETALDRLVAKFRAEHGLRATFACGVENLTLSSSVKHLLLRIAQESLYNCWKHASATEVEVRLGMNEGKLELVIADNGVGFDPALVPKGRYGLEGIRARAQALGAELLIDTAPNHGTRIVVQLRPAAV